MDIEQLRTYCLKLPAVTEDVKWDNDLCFSVGEKMFCVASLEPPLTVAFKVPDEDFELLSTRPGMMPAPYMARAKWVKVTDVSILSRTEWEAFVTQSYNLVKAKLTKKRREELGI